MALKNCLRCGKVYSPETEGDQLCPECIIEDKKDLKKVTDYLRKFPLANIMEVHERTGVAQTQLFRLIKTGSLKMRKPMEEFKCRICGREIKKGSVCDSCRSKIEGGIVDAERQMKKKQQAEIENKHRHRRHR